MSLSKPLKTQEKSLAPAPPAVPAPPPAAGNGKGRLMTTYDDFFGAAFEKFQAKPICCAHRGGRK